MALKIRVFDGSGKRLFGGETAFSSCLCIIRVISLTAFPNPTVTFAAGLKGIFQINFFKVVSDHRMSPL